MNRDLQIVNHYNLMPGDTIVTPKSSLELVQHYATYLGADDYGFHYVCDNNIGTGVKLMYVTAFFSSISKITRIEKFTGSNTERVQVVQKALSLLGRPYDLINYNCESFSNDIRYNQPKSKQSQNALALLATTATVLLIAAIADNE